jgi:hypothetical protein
VQAAVTNANPAALLQHAALPDLNIVIVIVDGAVITQLALLVEHKYLWCALSPVDLRHLLAFHGHFLWNRYRPGGVGDQLHE